ncbi:MAG: hypothetical protein HOC46_07070 [Candidatus Marinimicrobia bacterium]|jgi:hypothetical protein|nr:hypothetical protein [Candidatus Neomarinimicrobiota bacterium]MBT4593982.1 hypothetical protein [Candidatus Neomarinimicrobiota bacterium]
MKYIIIIISILLCFLLSSCESNELAPIEIGTVAIEYAIPQNGGNVFIDIQNRYTTSVKTDSLGYQESGRYLYSWSNQDENFYEGVYFIYIYLDGELLYDAKSLFLIKI